MVQNTPNFDWKSRSDLSKLVFMLIVGAGTGSFAKWINLPLPFLMGGGGQYDFSYFYGQPKIYFTALS